MSTTLTIRLTKEMADWLDQLSAESGVPQSRIVRDQLEKLKSESPEPAFMHLAGTIKGSRDLSRRKGFSRG